jgi:hypothetical protein
MIDFIMAQPDDRPINMSKNLYKHGEDECGCLMVEYVKDLFEVERGQVAAGLTNISIDNGETKKIKCVAEIDFSMKNLLQYSFSNTSNTFGELKRSIYFD